MSLDTSNQPQESEIFSRGKRDESRGGWIGGVVLIALGVIFLMQNFGIYSLDNWWALFILIPAISAFGAAWNIYRNNGGQVTPALTGSLVTGVILTLLSLSFLFGLNFGLIWPVFLILGGLSILLTTVSERP
ncbi:MAG: hypothetical protein R2873_23815 [Caldilineaceae bacterium]|nr:hypothetical protein [Caldilineaceae bacterium]